MPLAPLASFAFTNTSSTVTGTAAAAVTFNGTIQGTRNRPGTAVATVTLTATIAGTVIPSWGIPQNLVANAVSSSQIDLTWDEVIAATGYDIERDGVVIVFDHATEAYSDTGLAGSTLYTYRVRAVG